MKGRHHLEWYWLRNDQTLDRMRKGGCIHSLELIVIGAIGAAGATLIDSLNGHFVGSPSLVEPTRDSCASTKVLVELLSDASHDLLETGQLVLQVLQGILENVYLGVLLTNHLTKVATLTKS